MKRFNYIFLLFFVLIFVLSCGKSYQEEKRLTATELAKIKTEDSLSLKIAVMPTLDCLPIYVAQEYNLFDTLGVDVHLKYYTAQMDCDTAIARRRVEGSISDIIRAERLIREGTPLDYTISTNTYWQLITRRASRLKDLKQLEDKILAMTRYSATDYLARHTIDSVHLRSNKVFFVQVNDVQVRMNMMLNNEIDAGLYTEPQATAVRVLQNPVLMDSRNLNLKFGVLVFRSREMRDKRRQQQLKTFIKAYNQACDSINKNGFRYYKNIIVKYCRVQPNIVDSIPKLHYEHAHTSRQKEINISKHWKY